MITNPCQNSYTQKIDHVEFEYIFNTKGKKNLVCIEAVALESDAVKEIGCSLDNIEKIYRNTGKPMDYFDLIDIAQNWERQLQQIRKNQ